MKSSYLVGMFMCVGLPAFANREPNTTYDARSVGMGGTAAATASGSNAPFYNTARLSLIKKFHLGVTFSPYFPQFSGPWPDPMTFQPTTRDSSRLLAPLNMISVAYRVHPRLVLGLASFSAGGGGGKYENVPILGGNDAQVQAFIQEFQIPVAFEICEQLSIGMAYRMGYGKIMAKIAQPVDAMDPSKGFVTPETTFSGTTFAAFQMGINYQPLPNLTVGANYRSKLSVDMEGSTKIGDMTVADNLEANSSEPHRFILAVATKWLDDRLLFAADVNYWLYSESHKKDEAAGRLADWRDAYSMSFGGEFWAHQAFALRAGYAMSASATTDGAVSVFELPPSVRHTFTVGTGVRFSGFDLDAGFAYAVSPDYEIANAGTYGFKSMIGSLTGAYHF